MVFGKPFIASAFDAWVERLAGIDAGWFVQPGCAKDVAAALIEFAGNRTEAVQMGARGRKFTESYNWETESQKLLNLYRAL